jgi:hypothetical protein
MRSGGTGLKLAQDTLGISAAAHLPINYLAQLLWAGEIQHYSKGNMNSPPMRKVSFLLMKI